MEGVPAVVVEFRGGGGGDDEEDRPRRGKSFICSFLPQEQAYGLLYTC